MIRSLGIKSLPGKLQKYANAALTIVLLIFVTIVNIKARNLPELQNLFMLPVIAAGYAFTSTITVLTALISAIILFSLNLPLQVEKIIGLFTQSIFIVTFGLATSFITNLLKAQKESISFQKSQLLSLHRVNSNFISTLEPAAVVDQLTREARRLMVTDASLLVRVEFNNHLEPIAEENLNPEIISKILPSLSIIIEEKANSPDPQVIHRRKTSTTFPFASMIVAPVTGKMFLFLFSYNHRNFTRDEIEFLSTFLDESTIAINGATFYEAKQRQAQVISALASLNKAAALLKDTEELLHLALEKAIEINLSEQGILLLLSKNTIKLASSKLKTDKSLKYINERILKYQDPILIENLRKIKTYKVFHRKREQELLSEFTLPYELMEATDSRMSVFMPLIVKDRVAGVIILFNDNPRRLTQDELNILSTTCSEVSVVLYNSKLINDIKNVTYKTIESLSNAIDALSPYTRGHSRKVALIATKIARKIGLPLRSVKEIQYAALLHDFGKIFVNNEIYNSPRRLTPEEMKEIHKIPIMSSRMLENVNFFSTIIPIVRQHKEHYDGTGYPSGLKGNEIHIGARIISVAEAYVAMTSPRPFREPMSSEEAVNEILRNSGKQFDPNIVNALLKVLPEIEAFDRAGGKPAGHLN